MVCIYCTGNLAVVNSRPQLRSNQTWRRRLCRGCGAVFTAIERIDLSQAIVVHKDGQNAEKPGSPRRKNSHDAHADQAFDRDRLFISIYESLRHRPSATRDAGGLTDTVVAQLITHARTKPDQQLQARLSARTIAAAVLDTLQRFDKAAAIHYAAFHKSTRSD